MEKLALGFGGYFLDQAGGLHVWVTSNGNVEGARSAVRTRVRDERIATGRRNEPAVTIEVGAYTFSQLAEWRDIIFDEAQAGRLTQIRGLDADEATNRVLVEHTGSESDLRRTIAALGVIPEALTMRPAVGARDVSRSSALFAP